MSRAHLTLLRALRLKIGDARPQHVDRFLRLVQRAEGRQEWHEAVHQANAAVATQLPFR